MIHLVLPLVILFSCASGENPYKEWSAYLGDAGSSQYSELTQITTENVDKLEVAWTYDTGDMRENNRSQIQCNPIVVGSVLYASSPRLKIFALHAATGKAIWTFDPFAVITEENKRASTLGVNRGLMYWEEGEEKRILFAAGFHLYSLDAVTGKPDTVFGKNGRINMKEGLDQDVSGLYVLANTPGIIYKDLLILGTMVSEGNDAAPGHIRAYNVRTGEREWIFHTIPHPGEYGYETWPEDAWNKVGGANCWAGMSLDKERGVVYIPTGTASFDFSGGNRLGQNLFANCIIALNAETGERLWHFQTVHHDIWDRDLPCPPNLVTIHHEGRSIDVVAQVTKSGHVYVLDRDTGEPIFPVEERPYPPSDLDGEEAWPTQPLPLQPPPFARQVFTENDITNISAQAHKYILERFKKSRAGGQFIPPSLEGTILLPGFDGGGEWGGSAHDPTRGYSMLIQMKCHGF